MSAARRLAAAAALLVIPRLGAAQAPPRLGMTLGLGGLPTPVAGVAVSAGGLYAISSRLVASAELQTYVISVDHNVVSTAPCPPSGCVGGSYTTAATVKGADAAVVGLQLFETERHHGFYITVAGGPGRVRDTGGRSRMFLGFEAGFGLALPFGGAAITIEPRYVFLGNLYPDHPGVVPLFIGMRF